MLKKAEIHSSPSNEAARAVLSRRDGDTKKRKETCDGLVLEAQYGHTDPPLIFSKGCDTPFLSGSPGVEGTYSKKLKSRQDILIPSIVCCALPSMMSFLVTYPKNQKEKTGRNERLSCEMQSSWLIVRKGKSNSHISGFL